MNLHNGKKTSAVSNIPHERNWIFTVKVGSIDPVFGSNYFSGIVSAGRNVDSPH